MDGKMNLPRDFKEFLSLLNSKNVPFQNLKKNKASTGRLKDMTDLKNLGGAENEKN